MHVNSRALRSRLPFSQTDAVVIRSDRRTMAISVLPNGTIEVRVPKHCSDTQIVERLHKRRKWIQKQKRHFESETVNVACRRYVSGETHRYLGKQYRLKIKKSGDQRVSLLGGFIVISTTDRQSFTVKSLLEKWLNERAITIFREKAQKIAHRLKIHNFHASNIRLRKMKLRWGSCTPAGLIFLNPELVKVPGQCVEYVIVHELSHLKEPNHGKRFYLTLERVLPNWRALKDRLESCEL